MQIKTMTFNIHHGRGIDGKLNLRRIAKVIKESEADLISLNEVDRYFSKRSGYIDQVTWLAEYLKMNPAFGATLTIKSKGNAMYRQYGNALLSRYPIVFEKNHPFAVNRRHFEGRALLEIGIQIHDQRVKVYNTHLSLNPLSRKSQIDFIINKILNEDQPAMILGDFNMKPGSRTWKKLTEHLKDVCHAVGNIPYYTFPSFRPALQLDYIFVSRHIHITSAEVIKTFPAVSDHLPLQAALKLNESHTGKLLS